MNMPKVSAVLKTPMVAPIPNSWPLSIASADVVGMNKDSNTPSKMKMNANCGNVVEYPKTDTAIDTQSTDKIVSIDLL